MIATTTDTNVKYNYIDVYGLRMFYRSAGNANKPTRLNPDAWHHDQSYLDRPGSAARQMMMFRDCQTNVALYDQWQAYLRTHQPKTLVVWGSGDPFFGVAGAEAFKRDLPEAKIHLLNTGHFALEEDAPVVAQLIKEHF